METTRSFKTIPQNWDIQQRKQLHVAFNIWLSQASETEFEQFANLREQFAPYQVCSIIRLIRGCIQEPALLSQMPQSLRQLLRERNLLRPCAAAKSP